MPLSDCSVVLAILHNNFWSTLSLARFATNRN